MRIILKVSNNNAYCNGGCEFALMDLMPELGALALGRITALSSDSSGTPS
jgi:hypothetical protein